MTLVITATMTAFRVLRLGSFDDVNLAMTGEKYVLT